MNSVWLNLLWKEWREQRWKLAALCAINIVVPALCVLRHPEEFFGASTATLMFSVPLASMFIGMGVAAGEQSRGTIRFLQALPTSMRKPATIRLLVAAATVVVPILATCAFGLLWELCLVKTPLSNEQPIFDELAGVIWGITSVRPAVLLAGTIAALSFLVWMAAVGVNRSDEVRAGALGALAIAGIWVLVSFVHVQVTPPAPRPPGGLREATPPRWFRIASSAAPGGAALARETYDDSPSDWFAAYWPYIAVGLAANGAVAAWFIARFGRLAAGVRRTVARASLATPPAWLGPPRRSPAAAILWKQCRESLPVAAMGAAVVACLCVLAVLMQRRYGGASMAVQESMDMSLVAWMIVGLFVSVAAGLGLLLDDLRPGIHAFWRSRPIDVDRWFAIKFFTGLIVTIGILALPTLATAGYLAVVADDELRLADYAPQIGLMLMIQIGMYCAAVTAIALVRNPIYAAILAFGALAATSVVANWLDYRLAHAESFVIPALVVSLSVAASILAWLAVRNDWGWEV